MADTVVGVWMCAWMAECQAILWSALDKSVIYKCSLFTIYNTFSNVVVTPSLATISQQFGIPTLVTLMKIDFSVEDHASNIRTFKPQTGSLPLYLNYSSSSVWWKTHKKNVSSVVCLDSLALQTWSDMSGSSCTDYTGICEPQTFILMEGLWANSSRHESVS